MAKKRKTPGINGSSSADIAFMLLIFFLITTSMDTDKGLARRLPPLAPKQQNENPIEIRDRNVMRLLVNRSDEIVISRQNQVIPVKIEELKDVALEFILNPQNKPDLPEKEMRDIPFPQGNVKKSVVTQGYAISLKSEIETSYQMFISVQNELLRAYNEAWDIVAKDWFKKPYSELTPTEIKAINEGYPMHISEMPLSNLVK